MVTLSSDLLTVAVYTLGCKLNQVESESIADSFRQRGFLVVPWEDGPEDDALDNPRGSPTEGGGGSFILIINTCTVTSKSEQKARRVIRGALRNPLRPLVIVTGCYAQMEAEALEALETPSGSAPGERGETCGQTAGGRRLFVIPGERKNSIMELPGVLAPLRDKVTDAGNGNLVQRLVASWAAGIPGDALSFEALADSSFRFSPGRFTFHSRAFLKIQDGCDNRCAYCRVSLARGRSRSLAAASALSSLKALEEKGYGEAVLSGVNISQYHDAGQGGNLDLGGLLDFLLSGTSRISIRLSSIEPEVFSPGFIRAVSRERLRPHFHLSLQSASPAILRGMNRRYTPEDVLEGIRLLCSARDDPFLGCDIITGFPGETREDFERTFDFCVQAGFAGIHVFPFSRRPGTPAWDFKDRVTEKEAGLRAARLTELARKQRSAYIDRWLGREVEGIAEDVCFKEGAVALSANYLRLFVPRKDGAKIKAGTVVRCGILERVYGNPKSAEYGNRVDALAVIH